MTKGDAKAGTTRRITCSLGFNSHNCNTKKIEKYKKTKSCHITGMYSKVKAWRFSEEHDTRDFSSHLSQNKLSSDKRIDSLSPFQCRA